MAGGYFYQDNANVVFLDSTEIMVKEKIGWEVLQKHPLPHPMKDLRGISIQNKVFMIGKNVLCLSTQILPIMTAFILIHKFTPSCMKPILPIIS